MRSIIFLFFLFVLSCSSTQNLEYAKAYRALQAAEGEGATSSACGSRDFYTAQRYLKMAQSSIADGNEDRAKGFIETARKTAETSEEKTIFCGKK
jgi:hypothetical protein